MSYDTANQVLSTYSLFLKKLFEMKAPHNWVHGRSTNWVIKHELSGGKRGGLIVWRILLGSNIR